MWVATNGGLPAFLFFWDSAIEEKGALKSPDAFAELRNSLPSALAEGFLLKFIHGFSLTHFLQSDHLAKAGFTFFLTVS